MFSIFIADMDRFLPLLANIYFLAYYVAAIPVYNTQSTSLDDVYEFCNSAALNKFISQTSYPLSNFLLGMRSGPDENSFLESLSRKTEGTFSENEYGTYLGEKKNVNKIDNDIQLQDLFDTINDLRKACIFEYISEKRSTQNMKKDTEKLQLLDSNNYAGRGFKELLDARTVSDSAKRDAIGVNPTGWRKRRSNSINKDDMAKFLRNMKELLQKREKLSFNPTGW